MWGRDFGRMIKIDFSKPPKQSVVLVIVGVAILLWTLVRFAGPKSEVAQPGTQTGISLQSLTVKPPPTANSRGRVAWGGGWGRDPFALPFNVVLQSQPEVEETRGEEEVHPLPKLTAILIGDSRRLAVIDNLVVGVGDRVHGERVVKISADRVILAGRDPTAVWGVGTQSSLRP